MPFPIVGMIVLGTYHFNDYIREVCLKMNVSCPLDPIKSPYTGLREVPPLHLNFCKLEPS